MRPTVNTSCDRLRRPRHPYFCVLPYHKGRMTSPYQLQPAHASLGQGDLSHPQSQQSRGSVAYGSDSSRCARLFRLTNPILAGVVGETSIEWMKLGIMNTAAIRSDSYRCLTFEQPTKHCSLNVSQVFGCKPKVWQAANTAAAHPSLPAKWSISI